MLARANKTLIRKGLSIFLMLAIAAPLSFGRTRKGDRLLKEGQAAEETRRYDEALELYEQALQEDPLDTAYQLPARRVRFQTGQMHVDRGRKLRAEGRLEEASAEFQRAFAVDPASTLAQTELQRTLQMIDETKGDPNQTGESRGRTPGEIAQEGTEKRVSSIQPIPILKPISSVVTTLRMNNQPVRVLYETLGKLTGINVVFDPEFQQTGRNYTIDLTNTTLEDGLDTLAVLTRTYWKPLSQSTIFVTNDNVTKRRDYEDQVVKTFYIQNITTPQELQEIATVVRSVTDIRRVFTYNALGAIVVRGEVDKVVLAEKLIHDLDKPKSEVVVDVYVMEVSRIRTRNLAASLLSAAGQGLNVPIAFSPRSAIALGGSGDTGDDGGASTSTAIRLSDIGRLSTGDFALTLPGAMLQALMSDSGTRVLQAPQVRATDSVQSTLKIGDRYPYATGSFQPGVGTVGVSPLVSTQFQFADVGVNVNITPKIHTAEEVSLQVELDLSNIRGEVDLGGLTQPIIGQRAITHNVRLRQGEVSVIGGLMQDQDTRVVSGIPGLGNIPILNRLFTGESVERSQNELLIALVPHIIRSTDLTDVNLRGVAAGSDQVVDIRYQAVREGPQPEAAGPGPGGAAGEAAAPPTEAPKATVSPEPGAAQAAPATPAPAATTLQFESAAAEVEVSTIAIVTLSVQNAMDLFGAPVTIEFDSEKLRLNDITVGPLLTADGQLPIFSRNIFNDRGQANVILNRMPGTIGVSGSGTLLTFVFQAIAPGDATVSVVDVTLRNSRMETINANAPSVTLNVR